MFKMKVIGLTGGIASGKSTVTKMLKAKEIPVCDVDMIAKEVIAKGSIGLQRLVEEFGETLLTAQQTLNRHELATMIFSNATIRRRVDAILHPLILDKVAIWVSQQTAPLVVIDMPLLFEVGYDKHVDVTIVVYVDSDTQLERLMKRNGYTQLEAQQRIHAQMSIQTKVKKAAYVIDNTQTLEKTQEQLHKILEQLL